MLIENTIYDWVNNNFFNGTSSVESQFESCDELRNSLDATLYNCHLTWEDMKQIVNIADSILESTDKKELLLIGEEGYYNTVLNKYIKWKTNT